MVNQNLSAADRLIFALDVETEEEAKVLVNELKETIRFFKVGLQLFIAGGHNVVKWLVDQDLNVFLDLKMYDIGETIRRSVIEVSRLGVQFLTIHGEAQTVEAARAGKDNTDLKILFVTLLTSLGAEDFGGDKEVMKYVQQQGEMAMKNGCDGLITSGQSAPQLRATLGSYSPILVCPGIRPRGDIADDQKRIATPFEAISGGADYLVVGRPIRDAQDRIAKAEEIILEIDAALCSR
ncbi:MAG: orotidine-5'-phosphate decarboxylase [Acidobacteriota bacterium]|nr:orotidine-5'-phosphate decarboxylase [Acidobacteriota bacterium]